ncbi:MAG: glycoside hydrolase [Lentinula lateritia]|uniref:Glycoside hydrolase family 18 protein n=1 Tax=Lentinula lateritia TaxID=40482 RepID=A0ABQ8VHL1_9AGAR|nr:MAG: glycoside hydrolase [Lentinula lateritia]KAJ4494425.1 glycoside hydrolase family 18 protein [Lentinula lateritia]
MFSALLLSNILLLQAAISKADNATGSMRSVSWYAGWHSADFPLSQVSWSKYTQLTYAFATTTPDVRTLSLQDSDSELLPQFVQTAHQNNVTASISIGGWGGSQYFSTNVGSAANRTAFVKTVAGLATQYDLDGLDFDWEYPNRQGIGCNTINNNDTSNFLSFLQELRQDSTGSKLVLSAATSLLPWNNTSGTPSKDVSEFSKVLDFIAIMNYDVYNILSPHAGPNSPLNDTCAPTNDQTGSAVSSVKAWTDAGMPADQILLGVAAYGHSFVVPESTALESNSSINVTNVYPSFNKSAEHLGDKWDSPGGVDVCGNFSGPSGVYSYWGLVEAGYVNKDGTPTSGFAYLFDNCSQTPFVYDKSNQTWVSYDNVQSFALKGEFIKNNGLGGFAMWEAAGDLNDTLLDSIQSAISTSSVTSNNPNSNPSPSSSSVPSSAFRNAATTIILPLILMTVLSSVLV